MTPKEKALYLVLTYAILPEGCNDIVKRCATIAVDEIIDSLNNINEYDYIQSERITGMVLELEEVKLEIENYEN